MHFFIHIQRGKNRCSLAFQDDRNAGYVQAAKSLRKKRFRNSICFQSAGNKSNLLDIKCKSH